MKLIIKYSQWRGICSGLTQSFVKHCEAAQASHNRDISILKETINRLRMQSYHENNIMQKSKVNMLHNFEAHNIYCTLYSRSNATGCLSNNYFLGKNSYTEVKKIDIAEEEWDYFILNVNPINVKEEKETGHATLIIKSLNGIYFFDPNSGVYTFDDSSYFKNSQLSIIDEKSNLNIDLKRLTQKTQIGGYFSVFNLSKYPKFIVKIQQYKRIRTDTVLSLFIALNKLFKGYSKVKPPSTDKSIFANNLEQSLAELIQNLQKYFEKNNEYDKSLLNSSSYLRKLASFLENLMKESLALHVHKSNHKNNNSFLFREIKTIIQNFLHLFDRSINDKARLEHLCLNLNYNTVQNHPSFIYSHINELGKISL